MHAGVSFAAYVVFTLISGAAQDMLYTEYKFYETDAMSLVQSFVLFALGAISYGIRESGIISSLCAPHKSAFDKTGSVCSRVPWHTQLALGVSIAGNVLLTNYATEFLSFPIQVVFKSSKLLVAMAVRAIIFHKPNKRIDYWCGIALSLGLIGFMWPSSSTSDSPDAPTDNVLGSKFGLGLVCVLGSLLAEAVMLNVQEHYLFQKYEVSTEWVMMFGYLYSTVSQAALLAIVGTFGRTMHLLMHLDTAIAVLSFAFPAFMWIGVTFLLFLVKDHGAVVASAANVVRKAIAVAFSFIYFGREITTPIAVGTFLVFGSIFWRSVCHDSGHQLAATAAAPSTDVKKNDEDVQSILPEATPWPGAVQNPKESDDEGVEENPEPYLREPYDETQPMIGARKSLSRQGTSTV